MSRVSTSSVPFHLPEFKPMPLFRRPAPFSHPEWVYEIKHDGFRALAYIENGSVRLVSRRGHVYRGFPVLCDSIRYDLKAADAILDGGILSLLLRLSVNCVSPCCCGSRRPSLQAKALSDGHLYRTIYVCEESLKK